MTNIKQTMASVVENAAIAASQSISEVTSHPLDYGPTTTELFYEIQSQLESGKSQIILSRKYSHKAIKKVLTGLGYRPTTKRPELTFNVVKIAKRGTSKVTAQSNRKKIT